MSLFGSVQNKPSPFGGGSTTTPATQLQGTGLFGSSQPQTGTGLFGSSSQPQQGSGLFSSSAQPTNQQQPQQQSNVFGSFGQTQQQTQQPTSSLFGGQQNQQPQQPQQSTGLFGSSVAGQQQSNSLFGGQQTQQPSQSNGLFQPPAQAQPPSQNNGLFQASMQAQQPGNSLFGQQNKGTFSLGASQANLQQSQQFGRLWQPTSSMSAREKTVPEQMQTLLEKWSPQSPACLFQHYFYNHVPPEYVPYFKPGDGEDESKWEDALNKRPSEDVIPVLCKGFAALGDRLRVQVQSVGALQARLHEINNSLTAMLQAHDVDISVRASDARRRHVALSQRSLQLATKIQILRNRGYALDGAEEGLRRKLQELEKGVFDPRLNGRQEEVWARMVHLRERMRILQKDAEKAGASLAEGRGETLDPEILKQTKKILDDYDKQISHLSREMNSIRVEFGEWEGTEKNV